MSSNDTQSSRGVFDPSDIAANPYKADFPLLVANPGLAYLDSAATEQRPGTVIEAQRHFYETMNANPLRGLYRLSVEATEAVDAARQKVARLINAPSASEVVFVRNATEALNLAAHGLAEVQKLGPGDEVVISVGEHHSNLIPWQQVCERTGAKLVYLRFDEDFRITGEEMDAKIGPHTRIVSVAQVSNVLGVENPVRELAERAHKVGALMVVDGAQSVPRMKVDVQKIGCDLLVFSAHKLFGSLGIGVLWGKAEVLDRMPPMLTGGEMIDWVTEEGAAWAPIPQKFEAGTQDAAGIYAFGAALDYLDGVGLESVEAREAALMRYLCEQMEALPFIEVIGPKEPGRRHGVLAFNVEGVHPHDVASILDEDDVAIRAGNHCAQPLLTWLGCGACCRASIGLYNDKSDIDALVQGVKHVRKVFHGDE